MTATYDCIATTTLGSAAASVEFTSISGSFTDLIVILNGYTTHGAVRYILMQFNSDTGSNYSRTELFGNGSSAGSTRGSNETSIVCGDLPTDANKYGVSIIQIMNYSNTTTNKTILARGNDAATFAEAFVGLWRNTAAITTIKLMSQNDNFGSGTVVSLYGIKAE